ncbi:dipeptidase [Paenibacillus daejeonensis]|uniref:dipeptidase n=1 Tax=Paenibacillus daejeonensis TaxID=135193 RepID=UPI00035F1FF3|nr:dipeptidase [Paenibacillus daejeonensis]
MRGIADFHCDVLSKLLKEDSLDFNGSQTASLDVTYERLAQSGTVLQTFAIFIPAAAGAGIHPILQSIDLFHRKVLSCKGVQQIRTVGDLKRAAQSGSLAAMLSLEGVDGLEGHPELLRIMYLLGVRAVGLTWNHANWAADGIMEKRGSGLTAKGRQAVEICNELKLILDVSHLSERAFWEVVSQAEQPVIASHSNTRAVCDHPRNLTDEQLLALILMDGRIGITYVPWFVTQDAEPTIDDILRHVEHVCELGGERQLMLGSDFDGIDTHIQGLTNPVDTGRLIEAMLQRYSATQVDGFASGNAYRYLTKHLPTE